MSISRKNYLVYLLGGITLAALTTPALAQEAPQGSDATVGYNDIIVTAQRREERSQDVPVVISAFSTERLRELNVTKPQDLYGTVPSLVVGTQGQASRDVQTFSAANRPASSPCRPSPRI